MLLGAVVSTFPEPLTEQDRASVNAYLVLAHAVLEEQLEEVFERHFDRLASWLIADMVPLETARLVYAVRGWITEELNLPYKKRALHKQVAVASRKDFGKQVRLNNGLKFENVHALAKLVGVQWDEFEDHLSDELADLSNLGVKRGAAGHLSPFTDKVTALTANDDPDEIRRWVEAGRQAVARIEAYLDSLVRSQQPPSLIADWDGN